MRRGPTSYIIVLDNVEEDPTRETAHYVDGHTIETEDYFKALFAEAGLTIHKEEGRHLNENYGEARAWALY